MITEAQRRALFALREALHLCEAADVVVDARGANVLIEPHESEWGYKLKSEDIDSLLAKHPEPTEHNFRVEQTLRCLRVPDRHEDYFTPGKTYRVVAIDTSDTFLPLLMTCDSRITLWCESTAFGATA